MLTQQAETFRKASWIPATRTEAHAGPHVWLQVTVLATNGMRPDGIITVGMLMMGPDHGMLRRGGALVASGFRFLVPRSRLAQGPAGVMQNAG